MLVLDSAAVPTIADLKSHGKNLLKTLEIAHYAFIVSDLNHGNGIPHFSIKSSHIQELIAVALGFKTFAALQAEIKGNGMSFQSRKPAKSSEEPLLILDHSDLCSRIMSIVGIADENYGNFLSKYFMDYLVMSGTTLDGSLFALEPNKDNGLSKYLPFLKYLRVSPFSAPMRSVVENSHTFIYGYGVIEKNTLNTKDHFPLDGWIQIAILNNLLEESVDGYRAGYNLIKLPVHIFFQGTPRLSQQEDIFNFLESTSRIGSEYYSLKKEDEIWNIIPQKEDEDSKVAEYELIFEIQSRLKAIINDHVSDVASDTKSYSTYLMHGGNYQLEMLLSSFTPTVVLANIYEATEYFLTTCKNHLSDLNPVLHLGKEEALLSVRHPSVNEISWRRQVCDYAQNMLNAAKYFFTQCAVGLDELDLNKVYFNDYGFLMFDYDHDIEFYMYSLGHRITLNALDFSIFFNLFANVIYVKSEKITKPESKHMLAMSFLMFQLTKHLSSKTPALKFMGEVFDLNEFEEVLNVLLKRFDLVESKVEYGYIHFSETTKESQKTGLIYTVYPQGLAEEAALLTLLHKNHSEGLSAINLIKMLKGFSTGDEIKLPSPDKTQIYEAKTSPINMKMGLLESLVTMKMEDYLEVLQDLSAASEDGQVIGFGDVLLWVSNLFARTSYTKISESLKELKEVNENMYTILSYVLGKKNNQTFDENSFKEISVSTLKIYL